MLESARNLLSIQGVARLVDATLIRFVVIGLVTTLMDLVLFSALTSGAGINPVVANVFSYSCGIVTSFLLNRSWTFGVPTFPSSSIVSKMPGSRLSPGASTTMRS